MDATVFVAPHRFAAGVQNKVLQSLASGTPVVATPTVRAGLEPIPDGMMRVSDDADGLAAEVVSLLRDPIAAAAQGARAALWARNQFSWRVSLQALEAIRRPAEPETLLPRVVSVV